jgi:hypothetical protein
VLTIFVTNVITSLLVFPLRPLFLLSLLPLFDSRAHDFFFKKNRDFPGGEGESKCVGRGSVKDIKSAEGRRALGFEKFKVPPLAPQAEKDFFNNVNRILEL